jgi:uncharacterized protein with PQ loop repeat
MNPIAWFTVVGTAIGLVRAVPQFVRLLRARDAHGVSLDTAATSSIVSFAWAAYGILSGQLAVALASGSTAVMFAAVTVAALRFGRRLRELRTTPVWLAVLVASGVFGGARGLGLLLPVSVLVANVPQLRVVMRERDLTGLSVGTWLLSAAEGTVWGTYALFAADRSILVNGALQLATSAAIVAIRLARSPQARRPAS